MCTSKVVAAVVVKVFQYSFSETIPIFFNRIVLKVFFFPCLIAMKFSPVIGVGLKFVKM